MQLSQSLNLKQKQSLVMTPQLQQAIKLLQLTNLELRQFLEEQTFDNPFISVEEKNQASDTKDSFKHTRQVPDTQDSIRHRSHVSNT